jgi:tRNA G18 (ribose-2'-O)-methylase SpoU
MAALEQSPPPLVESMDDARVQAFRNLKDARAECREGLLICEGPEAIRLMLKQKAECDHLVRVRTLLLKPSAHAALVEDIAACPQLGSLQVLLMADKLMADLVGFSSCRGYLATAEIPEPRSLDWLAQRLEGKSRWRLLAVDGSNSTSNLGSMIRSASCFGCDGIILSHDCCDVWYRQCIRVSMGHCFRLPIVRADKPTEAGGAVAGMEKTQQQQQEVPVGAVEGCERDSGLGDALSRLHASHGVQSFAAVIDKSATLLKHLPPGSSPLRWCVVLGNEHSGVSLVARGACQRLRIDMEADVDSLSINNANAIMLNGLREREPDDNDERS